jgi:protein-arginine kinase activator protein McsA
MDNIVIKNLIYNAYTIIDKNFISFSSLNIPLNEKIEILDNMLSYYVDCEDYEKCEVIKSKIIELKNTNDVKSSKD